MPPPLVDPEIDDEEYASEEDSDFAPDEVAGDEGASSDSEADAADATPKAVPSTKKRKQAGDKAGEDGDAGFENSGDEAIIEKGKKRRKRGQQPARAGLDEEEGGEGGLIKTRSMRAVEKAERKAHAVTGPVTVDVDALWASMTTAPVVPTSQQQHQESSATKEGDSTEGTAPADSNDLQRRKKRDGPSETIKIKRTYNFAGKVHTEEKIVARDSAEARLYLASHPEADAAAAAAADGQEEEDGEGQDGKEKKRMPRKAFRSLFEPVLSLGDQPSTQRTDLNLAIAVRLRAREEAAAAAAADKARKLNTVEKSRMDWAGFVDKEGIKDELVLAGRAKGSFADRQDFLARSEARREEEARRVRLAGKT